MFRFYKGLVMVVVCILFGLFYLMDFVIFEEGLGIYDYYDVEGFIKFNGLCLKGWVVCNVRLWMVMCGLEIM